jgi:hypothetical protein
MDDVLPTDVLWGAELRGKEYGWNVASFPDALARAEEHSYACLRDNFSFAYATAVPVRCTG